MWVNRLALCKTESKSAKAGTQTSGSFVSYCHFSSKIPSISSWELVLSLMSGNVDRATEKEEESGRGGWQSLTWEQSSMTSSTTEVLDFIHTRPGKGKRNHMNMQLAQNFSATAFDAGRFTSDLARQLSEPTFTDSKKTRQGSFQRNLWRRWFTPTLSFQFDACTTDVRHTCERKLAAFLLSPRSGRKGEVGNSLMKRGKVWKSHLQKRRLRSLSPRLLVLEPPQRWLTWTSAAWCVRSFQGCVSAGASIRETPLWIQRGQRGTCYINTKI